MPENEVQNLPQNENYIPHNKILEHFTERELRTFYKMRNFYILQNERLRAQYFIELQLRSVHRMRARAFHLKHSRMRAQNMNPLLHRYNVQ